MGEPATKRQIVVSGMRPTGALHLGHFHGVIENWVKIQNDPRFEKLYIFSADYHSLTTEYENTAGIQKYNHEMILDWLSFGVDPNKAICFVQSHVPEHAELSLLLSMLTPVAWLERVPSYKDLQKELNRDLATHGFLGYPVLQTADVAMYGGTHVPVGQDQVAHIELSREIVRRFNHIAKKEVLAEPQPLLTTVPKLPGTDGRKMSKSYGNSIYLSDTAAERQKKVLPMMTDPARVRRTDAGDPEKCPVFDYHKIYTSTEQQSEITSGCTQAKIGCVDCKKILLKGMDARLDPFVEKRQELLKTPDVIADVMATGDAKARAVAQRQTAEVKAVMGL